MSGDPYRVDVTWLCRPKDLPKQVSYLGGQNVGQFSRRSECTSVSLEVKM